MVLPRAASWKKSLPRALSCSASEVSTTFGPGAVARTVSISTASGDDLAGVLLLVLAAVQAQRQLVADEEVVLAGREVLAAGLDLLREARHLAGGDGAALERGQVVVLVQLVAEAAGGLDLQRRLLRRARVLVAARLPDQLGAAAVGVQRQVDRRGQLDPAHAGDGIDRLQPLLLARLLRLGDQVDLQPLALEDMGEGLTLVVRERHVVVGADAVRRLVVVQRPGADRDAQVLVAARRGGGC